MRVAAAVEQVVGGDLDDAAMWTPAPPAAAEAEVAGAAGGSVRLVLNWAPI